LYSNDLRDLFRRLSRENPLWSAERIGDTLRLLACDPPCDDTIRKYMHEPKNQPDKPTNWLPFLRNHLDISWAMDFFTVITLSFSFLYVFVVFDHGRVGAREKTRIRQPTDSRDVDRSKRGWPPASLRWAGFQ
jgi:hypothetical protein